MRSLAVATGILAVGSTFATQADEVKLLNWEAYLADEVIDAFHRETGHTVNQFFFKHDSERNILIASGRSNQFDLILLDDMDLAMFAPEGKLRSMASLDLANSAHIDARWQQSCGEHGLAYAWGTLGIAYRSSLTDQPIASWQQFFTPPRAHQDRLVVHPDIVDLPAAALIAAGQSIHTSDRTRLEQVYDLLKQQQPHVLAYDYGVSYAITHGSQSQMSMTLAYSADVETIIDNTSQQDWVYSVPREGTLIWVDCWTAPAERPLSPATRAFLEFINRPDIAALNAERTWFATPISAARPLTNERYQADSELFPAAALMANSQTYQVQTTQGFALRSRMIAAIKQR